MENNNQGTTNNATPKMGLKDKFAAFKAGHPKTCKLVKRAAFVAAVAGAFVLGTRQGSTGSSYDSGSESEPTTDSEATSE